ncbi:hypothetical protein C922_02198 [Plasmodium inui San Antonio 1]|uniref:Uncharacterized protein n=1 Tax=Plasmodium inui San Antonio 1 TaxID=1237626 RepID=W7A2N6_9APIC|nr:hypothetical protein C922_02198 [Plasmodium inui San Antonio 1]EUD67492.1 hypothetical protein C922_02198 [Plasmodium inui San Antonio 1]
MIHLRDALRKGGAIKCVSIVESRRRIWDKELNRFSPIGNRKLHSTSSPNGEPREDNNSGNLIGEKKKKNNNFFKSLFVTTFFCYTFYESLHIIKDHELVREKIKQLPALSDFIDLKIMPLVMFLDGMAGKLKGYLLVIVKNGNYYSLHLYRSLKAFIFKSDDNFRIFAGPVERRDLSEPLSFLREENSIDVPGEPGDGEGGTPATDATTPTAILHEDNLKHAHIAEVPPSELHSLIYFDEEVHGANSMPEGGTHYEGLPRQGTPKETEDANTVIETSPNGNLEEHSSSDDIRVVIDLFNKGNSPDGEEEQDVLNLYSEDMATACPIDGYDDMSTGGTTVENTSDGEETSHGEEERVGKKEMFLAGQVEETESMTNGHHKPNENICANGEANNRGEDYRADVPLNSEAQQPPRISSIKEIQQLFSDGVVNVTKKTQDEENKEQRYTNPHRKTAKTLVEVKGLCKEEQKKDGGAEKVSTYETNADILPQSASHYVEEKDTTEGGEPRAKTKRNDNCDDQYNPNTPQRNPKNGTHIKALIAEGRSEIPLNDREIKGIVKSEVEKFEGEIKELSKEELKDKIITMFLNELIARKYKDILMEEEKEALMRVLTIKYNDIYLKEKEKMQKKLEKCMRKKLKQAEMILKKSYESEKEIFSCLMRNQKKEEVKMERNKIEDELNRVRENYLSKINSYACDVDAMRDNHFREKVKMEKLETINDIQNILVHLQNCIIQDLSIESILTDLKRKFKKDPFLDTVFATLPDNFFSHTFKPTWNNIDKMKKEFYILYKEGVREAFIQHNENYFIKKIIGRVGSFFYLNYEAKMSIILHRALKDDSALKSNLVHLSYALSSVQQNDFVDALRYIDELTGSCKNTFSPFSEHVRNVILFRYYLRLAVSRLMLAGKALRLAE